MGTEAMVIVMVSVVIVAKVMGTIVMEVVLAQRNRGGENSREWWKMFSTSFELNSIHLQKCFQLVKILSHQTLKNMENNFSMETKGSVRLKVDFSGCLYYVYKKLTDLTINCQYNLGLFCFSVEYKSV